MTELYDQVLGCLTSEEAPPRDVCALIDAAFHGDEAIRAALNMDEVREVSAPHRGARSTASKAGAFLETLSVTGFRGIAGRTTLRVTPGPGLTLVIGRNGSGKSSLAEGLETLLTGDNLRWAQQSARREWEQGWKNLHHPGERCLQACFVAEGGPLEIERRWKSEEFGASALEIRLRGQAVSDFASIGWAEALASYRPLLSYSELRSLYERPSALYDALQALLGLDELTAAVARLRSARLEAEKEAKDVKARLKPLLNALRDHPDPRAAAALAAIEGNQWDLVALGEVLREQDEAGASGGDDNVLRTLAGLSGPDPARVAEAAQAIRDAAERKAKLAESDVERAARVARLLEDALVLHQRFDTRSCPVCGQAGALGGSWADEARVEIEIQRAAAQAHQMAHDAERNALHHAQRLIRPAAPALDRAAEVGIDAAAVLKRWTAWESAPKDPLALAEHLTRHAADLHEAVQAVAATASKALAAREAAWRPLADALLAWRLSALSVEAAAPKVRSLTAAEKWLKALGDRIRDERFAPIAEHVQSVWRQLRQDSNVDVTEVALTGRANRRRLELKVTVDDIEGVALGVMSQGELNALALSLFLPRACLDDSPFRFIVIDDPVQSMDPARVDGLARVLEGTARNRQVVVFTHDDRLFEAIRRLQIPADVLEVHRRGRSNIEIRQAADPIERYLDDARRVASAESRLGPEIARRVVPGLCRSALEAALTRAVRRRRLSRGEGHRQVEEIIDSASRTTSLAALGLFDDTSRGADVLRELNTRFGSWAADVYQQVKRGAHGDFSGDYYQLVLNSGRLARALEELA